MFFARIDGAVPLAAMNATRLLVRHEKARRQPGQDPDQKKIACEICMRADAFIAILA
jgi:hypothetical protein